MILISFFSIIPFFHKNYLFLYFFFNSAKCFFINFSGTSVILAEIFNIVINQTVETKWFEKSHSEGNVILIDEEGLNDVLEGKEPKPFNKPLKKIQFRF